MNLKTIETSHGKIELPVFMPVGTKGTVKAVAPKDLENLNVQVVLGNTYHLYLRPGHKLIKKMGGLHEFMSWNRPILTDSGGFQVFSLSELRKINEEGASFKSHIDGSSHFLTPELSMEIQDDLGADIRMVFDECPASNNDKTYIEKSLALTSRWAKRSKDKWESLGKKDKLFGIIQGGMHKDLRLRSLNEIQEIGFDGYAIGGLSVGENKETMYEVIQSTMEYLKIEKPVYLMGIGDPIDILFAVKNGIDMFDCVMPTRNARNGCLFTFDGKISIKQAKYIDDKKPIEDGCDCYACQNFSRSYLRHLYVNKELLSYQLNTIHNLKFFMKFMQNIRKSIKNKEFSKFYTDFLDKYNKR
jgi:queuine tRNA-ribosyltransferase